MYFTSLIWIYLQWLLKASSSHSNISVFSGWVWLAAFSLEDEVTCLLFALTQAFWSTSWTLWMLPCWHLELGYVTLLSISFIGGGVVNPDELRLFFQKWVANYSISSVLSVLADSLRICSHMFTPGAIKIWLEFIHKIWNPHMWLSFLRFPHCFLLIFVTQTLFSDSPVSKTYRFLHKF